MYLTKGILDNKQPKKYEQVYRASRRVSTETITEDDSPLKHPLERLPLAPDSHDLDIFTRIKPKDMTEGSSRGFFLTSSGNLIFVNRHKNYKSKSSKTDPNKTSK